MHSKYLKCDRCEAVIDRRPKDDFGGTYRKTQSRGTFAVGEGDQLLSYARSLGWSIHENVHLCPLHH
jgi:hypothetical protein